MEKVCFFKNKYEPKIKEDLDFNTKLIPLLNNLIIVGPPGSGKRTRALVIINELKNRDNRVFKIKYNETSIDKTPTDKTTFTYGESFHHIEITPTGFTSDDRVILTNFVKSIIKIPRYYTEDKHIILIRDANKLSNLVFQALRVLMEKYYKNAVFIFLVENMSRIPSPIISRCIFLKNPSPTDTDISKIIHKITDGENIKISNLNVRKIIENAKFVEYVDLNNLFYVLQMSFPTYEKYSMFNIDSFQLVDKLYTYIKMPINKINIKTISEIRDVIYDIMLNEIKLVDVYHHILNNLMESDCYNESQKLSIIQLISELERSSKQGNKEPIHLEALVFNLIDLLK
jgi:replication factor C subunit 3/5